MRTLDLRLVPAAAAAWVAALLVVRAPAAGALVTTAVLALAGLAAGLIGLRRRWGGASRESCRSVGALALLTAACVAGAGAAQVDARAHGLLPELARTQGAGVLVGRVVGEPQPVRATWPGAPPRVRWVLAASSVTTGNGAGGNVVGGSVTGGSGASDGRTSAASGQVAVLGDPSERAAYGAVVAVAGRLRAGTPGAREVAVLVASGPVTVRASPRAWDALAARVRAGVRMLADDLPGDARALLPGVTVGDTSAVPDDLTDAMRASGLTHLVAVSGAHFALVAALVLATGAALRASPRMQALATAGVTLAMLVLVHPAPSVVRAAAMGAVGVVGLAAGRPARSPAALGAAVVVLLVADPWLAGELGFALSVAATAGIVLLGGPLARRWSGRLGTGPATALAVPVAAQLTCGPVVLAVSGSVTPWGVVANVVAAPAVAPATLLGLLSAVLAPWWPALAPPVSAAAGAACWWIGAVARRCASLPGAQLEWLPGVTGTLLLAAVGVAAARLLLGARRGVSAGSGRLDPCPPRPVPAVPRARPVQARPAPARAAREPRAGRQG
ncbi:ComEC/Rec2 family competence protein [Cellulomonas persica]|uniref:ComEC/Rec2 family competence protein n=1 Tax=Cellulomonas persica TaxID=76861 RepID=UPI0011BF04E1|nr:ComEC/Rec2 family competence protein [Cellulomonas persica]